MFKFFMFCMKLFIRLNVYFFIMFIIVPNYYEFLLFITLTDVVGSFLIIVLPVWFIRVLYAYVFIFSFALFLLFFDATYGVEIFSGFFPNFFFKVRVFYCIYSINLIFIAVLFVISKYGRKSVYWFSRVDIYIKNKLLKEHKRLFKAYTSITEKQLNRIIKFPSKLNFYLKNSNHSFFQKVLNSLVYTVKTLLCTIIVIIFIYLSHVMIFDIITTSYNFKSFELYHLAINLYDIFFFLLKIIKILLGI